MLLKQVIPSLSHQKMQANWLKENEELMQKFPVLQLPILSQMLRFRGILKIIFSFPKTASPL